MPASLLPSYSFQSNMRLPLHISRKIKLMEEKRDKLLKWILFKITKYCPCESEPSAHEEMESL